MDNSRIFLKKCRWSMIMLAVLILLGIGVQPVYAQQLVGSIQLDCHVQLGDETIPLTGDTYAIVQIADITVQEQNGSAILNYQTRKEFASADCNWAGLTDRNRQEKAQELARYAQENHLLTTTKITDANGITTFEGLSTGLYLIVRKKVAMVNEAYSIKPFLADIPTNLSGDVYYDVTAVPKFETEEPETEEPETEEPERKPILALFVPQTGDTAPIGLIVMVLIVSVSALLVIPFVRKRTNDKKQGNRPIAK